MQDVNQIDWTQPYGKIVSLDVAKQKVFFSQNGIDYGADGTAMNPKQIKDHYVKVATEAQEVADAAKLAADEAQQHAADMRKAGGVTKASLKSG